MFNDIALFVKIAQHPNLTSASKELGFYQSTLSRKISFLEQQMETKLLFRDSRNLRLTSAGEVLYTNFCNLEEDFSQLVFSITELANNQEIIKNLKCEPLIDEVFLFVRLMKLGSYTRCSKITRTSKSTVSRKINELEEKFGRSLLVRDSHKLEPTSFGQIIFNHFEMLNSKYSDLLGKFTGKTKKAKGQVKISVPYLLSYHYILPKLGDFLRKHPDLEIAMFHDQNEFNLNSKGYDLAIIHYTPKQQNAKMRILGSDKIIGVCSKKYAENNGLLTRIEDLDQHLVVGKPTINGEKLKDIDIFKEKTNERLSITNPSRLVMSSFAHTHYLVVNHSAMAALPYDIVRRGLDDGELIHLIPEYHFGIINYVLVRNIEETNPVYKLLLDFFLECLKPLTKVLDRRRVDVWYE